MALKVYVYKNCGTCKKAEKWLDAQGIDYKSVPIRETPPSPAELKRMLGYLDGNLKKLFNTAGGDYRELGLKDKVGSMSTAEAIALLSSNGNLVKRPFALGKGCGTVGFKEDTWSALFAG